ncbi:hypothetical protein CAPTEDRAFT_21698 [Capitella teleta]|uniref:S-formylglutathione hydrolase n=1 Tax=Capitella teleta TaxID=283909 RepID=R7TVP2_CAPTE|nr:hypothetical protein CAPTEDRAFT_21698 [Capitella teleta]|eukprot:ELT97779.1 hypothetical protein CAPTEDRAFT_21698 [Capitella teleta]
MSSLTQTACNKIFGGWQKIFTHDSSETKCKMTFGIYLPPQADDECKVPVIYWLSGLTCTEQNFVTKAGAQRYAAQHGIAIVAPDTSPRGCNIEGEDESYDFGSGAGFYVDATQEKWKTNYRMYSYITKELPDIVNANFPVLADKQSIMGHSMGGHGALTLFLKNPGMYQSVSAFAPICNPVQCAWGQKALAGYLGEDKEAWMDSDSCCLVKNYSGPTSDILIDQGQDDNFLSQGQLLPDNFLAACNSNNVPVILRMQEGYDHSYFFIATFIGEHIAHHAKYLK